MGQIAAIPVEYKDVWFKSKLEARWAVFFDEMGIEWEYEPESFNMDYGMKYTPDFLLKNVRWRGEDAKYAGKFSGKIYVEVKGVYSYKEITSTERARIETFSKSMCLLVLGSLFDKEPDDFVQFEDQLSSYTFLDGDWEYPCFFSRYKGEIWLCGPDHDEWDCGKSAEMPLAIAKQARF